jgi:hypothetical protein
LLCIQVAVKARVFRQVPDHSLYFDGLSCRIDSKHFDFATSRFGQTQEHEKHGGFPGPVWAKKTKDLTLQDPEGKIIDCRLSVIDFG